MKARSLEELVDYLSTGKKASYVFFWGHTQRGPEIDQSCLSQWFPSKFVHSSVTFETAEHFMMYHKAVLFGDSEIASRILEVRSPGEAKALGRKVRGFDKDAWIKIRWDIVVAGNYAKFSQNEPLREYIVATGSRVLVEASPVDQIWGIGMDRVSAIDLHPKEWRGENILGFALMEARSRLLQSGT